MPDSATQVNPAVNANLAGPYIGLRPFERVEKEIFFGRERDSVFLMDKIFSARLTLLYAPSGVGKSSILRTLVTPALEEQHAWVKYFDNWTGDDPCATMKARLVKFASELGVADVKSDAPLTEIIGQIAQADDRTGVLILDQFEEFLVTHGRQLDPLRKELAALVRASKLDLRIVLSLRQEFLAALEPFRNEILNLFQSTYLLDSLDEQGLRDAIEKPVQKFGGDYEAALTDKLVNDLRADGDRGALPITASPVDLPMMQIVCGRLWEVAAKRNQTRLTLALYTELGGADKILEKYVREVMPRKWSDKVLTARLMRLLAPGSGLKKSYSSAELAENDNLDPDRVSAELERLSAQRILRIREYHGQKLYELQHDAFIRFITPWREEVLQKEKLRQRFKWVGAGAVITVVMIGLYLAADYRELKKSEALISSLKDESLENRHKFAAVRLDTATTDLLFRWKSYAALSDLLEKNKEMIPDGYGLANAPTEESESTDSDDRTPPSGDQKCPFICVHYSSERKLDQSYFEQEWRYLATAYFAKRGIPVPLQLPLYPDPQYPTRRIVITSGDKTVSTSTAPLYEPYVFVATEGLRGPAKDFLDRFRGDRKQIGADEVPFNLGPLAVVPPWTRPVWKVAGNPASDGRGLAAVYVAAELMKNPAPLFNDEAMHLLLEKARALCPQTVDEAIAARGYENLRLDLAELVRRGQSLTHLPSILDALAAYPATDAKNTPQNVAEEVDAELSKERARIPARLGGPWPPITSRDNSESKAGAAQAKAASSSAKAAQPAAKPAAEPATYSRAYDDVKPWLPSLERPVKVYLGRTLDEQWFTGRDSILGRRLNELRDEIVRQYGVELVGPLIFLTGSANPLQAQAYRFETVDPQTPECVWPAVQQAGVDQFIDTLRTCTVATRTDWVTSEDAFSQRQMTSPGMVKWLDGTYSLTAQKQLMRAVVAGGLDVSQASGGKANQISPDETLWHPDWLFRSLVFWSQAGDDPLDTAKMAEDLRRTQRARLTPAAESAADQPAGRLVATGIAALQADQVPAAQAAFARAVTADRKAAITSFLAEYPQMLRPLELGKAEVLCSNPTPPYYSSPAYRYLRQRIALEETRDTWGNSLAPDMARHLGLCALAINSGGYREMRVGLETGLLLKHNPGDWSPQEARWLAERTLSDYDPYSDGPELRNAASQLLKNAVVNLPPKDSRAAFRFVLGDFDNHFTLRKMDQPGPKAWRIGLVRELAEARPEPGNELDVVNQLNQSDRKEDLEEVVRIAGHAPQIVQMEPNLQYRDNNLAGFIYYRAAALERLSTLGIADPKLHLKDRRAEADDALTELGKHKGWEETAAGLQMEFLEERGDCAKALGLGRRVMTTYADAANHDAVIYQVMLQCELLTGDTNGAEDTAKQTEDLGELARAKQDTDQESEMMFAAALGRIATGSPTMEETARKFLTTDHPYVPYVAMMLYSRMASAQTQEEAVTLLNERLDKADRRHWKERLRGGDESAWREMLIGLYLNQVQPQTIFDPLKDDRSFAASDLSSLPMSREDMMCEAYFYAALLAESKRDRKTRDADLQKVLDTRVTYFIEYDLAKFMQAQQGASQ
jgi:hypothetical protein